MCSWARRWSWILRLEFCSHTSIHTYFVEATHNQRKINKFFQCHSALSAFLVC